MKKLSSLIVVLATLIVLPGCSTGIYNNTINRSETILSHRLKKTDVKYIAQGDKAKLVFPADAYFESDSAKIFEHKYTTLNNVTALLNRYPKSKFTITGYSDDVAADHANKKMSLHRAESFLAYFWAHGMNQEKLTAIGKGANDPVASNETSKGSGMNRRVEITWDKSGA